MNLFYPMLLSGLLTSFHCVMMCGNMVLSYAVKGSEEGPLFQRLKPHFAYHGAKIVSYTAVGLLLGSIGSFISQEARSWVSVLAGVYMVLLGLNMTGKFPALQRLTPRPPRFLMNALMKMRKKASSDAAEGESSIATPISFGLMTGLMPCGPLQAAQVAAAGAGSTFAGGMAMLGFGLGTAPLMLGYGAVASFLSGRFKKNMAIAAAVVVMVLGLVMVNRGATALGWPVNFNTIKQAVVGTSPVALDESQFKTGADGVIEVPLVIENVRYQPQTLAIPADKPVRLVVERREDNVCSEQLWIPNLGIQAPLTPNGVTTIELPATKAGNYQLTCQMGMMAGTLQVGAAAASTGPAINPNLLILIALLAAGVAIDRYSRRQRAAQEAERSSHRKGGHAPAPVPVGLFGMTPQETLFSIAGVSGAVLIGLIMGGWFA